MNTYRLYHVSDAHEMFYNQVEISSDILKTHRFLISWRKCLHITNLINSLVVLCTKYKIILL